MAQGRLERVGSITGLKERYGGGCLLEVCARQQEPDQARRLAAFLEDELGGRQLGESQFGRAKFQLPARGQVRHYTCNMSPCAHETTESTHTWIYLPAPPYFATSRTTCCMSGGSRVSSAHHSPLL